MLTALASAGAVLILSPVTAPTGKALAFALLMAVSFALYVVLTRMLRHETLSANLFYTAVGALLPLSLYVPRIWVMPSAHDAVILFGIGAVGLAALMALDRALERTESSMSAAFVTAQVPAALLMLWLRHTALVSRQTLLGLAAISVSLLALWRFGKRADPVAE